MQNCSPQRLLIDELDTIDMIVQNMNTDEVRNESNWKNNTLKSKLKYAGVKSLGVQATGTVEF